MTVRLLCDWEDSRDGRRYKVGNLLTTDAGTEAGLVAAKLADTDLTGGTQYVDPPMQKQFFPVMGEYDHVTGGIEKVAVGGVDILSRVIFPAGLAADGVTSDTAKINAVTAAFSTQATEANPVVIRLPAGFAYALAEPIILYSNMTLDISGCQILHSGTGRSIVRNRAADVVQRSVSDGVLTAGSDIVESATAAFTQADVGRSLQSNKGSTGNAGYVHLNNNKYFSGLIVEVISATQARIAHAASESATAATFKIYDRDKNIAIIGDHRSMVTRDIAAAQSGDELNSIILRRVDGLRLHGLKYQSTAAKYFIQCNDVTRVRVSDIHFPSTNSDGVHITGPMSDVIIERITGKTGDDIVAIGCADYTQYSDTQGPISDVTIRHVKTTGVSGGVALFALANDPYHTMRDVLVDNVSGPYKNWLTRVESGTGDTLSIIDGVVLRRIKAGAAQINTQPVIFLKGVIGDVTIDEIYDDGGTNAAQVRVNNDTTVSRLAVTNAKRTVNATSNAVVSSGTGSVIGALLVSTRHLVFKTGVNADVISIGGQCSQITLSGFSAKLHSGIKVINLNTAQSALTLAVSNGRMTDGTGGYLYWLRGVVDLQINNVDHGPCYMAISAKDSGTVINVSGAGIKWAPTIAAQGDAGSSIHLQSFAIRGELDRSGIAHANGNMAFNTKAALGCGAGPVVSNGTTWKNLYTGATT